MQLVMAAVYIYIIKDFEPGQKWPKHPDDAEDDVVSSTCSMTIADSLDELPSGKTMVPFEEEKVVLETANDLKKQRRDDAAMSCEHNV